jgi:hypothetical protein
MISSSVRSRIQGVLNRDQAKFGYILALIQSFQVPLAQSNSPLIKKKLRGLSPRENCTDRATAACRRSDRQLLRIESATRSA